jgi:hypothetical protein
MPTPPGSPRSTPNTVSTVVNPGESSQEGSPIRTNANQAHPRATLQGNNNQPQDTFEQEVDQRPPTAPASPQSPPARLIMRPDPSRNAPGAPLRARRPAPEQDRSLQFDLKRRLDFN